MKRHGEEEVEKHLQISALGKIFNERNVTNSEPVPLQRLLLQTYDDCKTPHEELKVMLASVADAFAADLEESMKIDHLPSTFLLRREAKIKAIISRLGVLPSGASLPLSLINTVKYHTPPDRIAKKIAAARKKATDIVESLGSFEAEEHRDCVMIQHFILEQVEVFKRFGLSKMFFIFDLLAPESVSAIPWIVSWLIVSGALCFFVYWVFAWGSYAGPRTMQGWGINLGIGAAQDIMLSQPLKIFMVYVIGIELVKPQLRVIHRSLTAIASAYAQDGYDKSREFHVVQHLSGACRAARLSAARDLPASYILRQVDDFDIQTCAQHKHYSLVSFQDIIILNCIGILTFGNCRDSSYLCWLLYLVLLLSSTKG